MRRSGRRLLLVAILLGALDSQVQTALGQCGCLADAPAPATADCDLGGCGLAGFDGSACDAFCGSSCNVDSFGFIKRSDRCFDDFISPMINFVFFEDPRTLTEVRPIFVTQSIPDTIGSGIPAGGSAQLYAMHVRVALTERLSFIAVKDGYVVDNTEGALDTILDDGWADVSAGLKYNFLRDTESGTLASGGFTFELPIGSQSALQGNGDGQFHFFLTGGQRFLDGNAHLLSSVGYRVPVDEASQTEAFHWSNHVDYKLTNRLYVFTEAAWWHWTDDATDGLPLGVAGQDLFNLSSTNVAGNDLVTENVGLKFKPRSNIETGIAYEFPLTGFQDVIQDRLMLDLIVRF